MQVQNYMSCDVYLYCLPSLPHFKHSLSAPTFTPEIQSNLTTIANEKEIDPTTFTSEIQSYLTKAS